MIPQRNLSLLSNRLARRGGRRIPEAILERDYCISWFLSGLSRCSLKDVLLFKGGTALKKCYFPDYRFSEDIDFTMAEEISFDEVRKNLDIAFEHVKGDSGVKLHISRLDRHSHQNSHTFFLGYEGPLPVVFVREIKVDMTIREKIVFPIVEKRVLKGYDEYEDLPPDAVIRVYSIDEIAAEKIVALLDRARNEPRDLYDIWHLHSGGYVELFRLADAVEQKLSFRGGSTLRAGEEFGRKEARLRKLWEVRLSPQMTRLPEFDGVFRDVKRELKRLRILRTV